jgi:hypothetical protein
VAFLQRFPADESAPRQRGDRPVGMTNMIKR